MASDRPQKPSKLPNAPVAQSREERLKAALKANMAKRKAQAKARKPQTGTAEQ